MPADRDPFRVLTTPGYQRDFRAISHGYPRVIDAMQELLTTLRGDPYNRSGQHQIKKLTGCKKGEGQWRIRWKQYRLRYDILGSDVVFVLVPAPEESLLILTPQSDGVLSFCVARPVSPRHSRAAVPR
jgi:mRNA-degrading endonuclease RelE of RelBE toxin-antitoxin system